MTTVNLQTQAAKRVLERVIADGYGMRGKSKWIVDALKAFLALPSYPEFVDMADNIEGQTTVISLRLPIELVNKIDEAVIEVRKQYPNAEGVRSNIIRASIMQELIRGTLRSPKLS